MPQFVIHIGPHKSASSSLQAGLKHLAGWLREAGVLYPTELGTKGHELLPPELADPDRRGAAAGGLAGYADADCDTVVLSAEELSRLKVDSIEALREMLGHHPVRIVFYCRAWGPVCASQWNQRVRIGFGTALDAVMRHRLEMPRRSGSINYAKPLDRWAKVFGPRALHLVSLEALAQRGLDIVRHFAGSFLNVAPLPTSWAGHSVVNRSVPLIDAEIIRALNQLRIDRTGHRDSYMASRFLRRQWSLKTGAIGDRLAQHHDTMIFDEREPKLTTLHRHLFTKFGDHLVEPRLDGVFFTPQARPIDFIRGDYLSDPLVIEDLDGLYERLSDGSDGAGAGEAVTLVDGSLQQGV